jgi:hypothetical protein
MPRKLDPFRGKKILGSSNKAHRQKKLDKAKGKPFPSSAGFAEAHCPSLQTAHGRHREITKGLMGPLKPFGWHGCRLDHGSNADRESEEGEG